MKVCPRCSRAAATPEEFQARCGDRDQLGCPTPRDVIPGKDIILTCRADACDKTFAIPAVSIVRVVDGRRSIPADVSCMRSPCEIVALANVPQEEKPSKPPKGRQAPRE